ncbi:HD domain-containing protein [uncultured Clostridium sp.]|uniref:HD domain-containing protein n=1 Tax=uncultured Clostridium sp. TaxID=59620 RepID=UPI00143516DF|nr:HD domain-containing protein [uncultured Clostridium sp.]GFI30813.1 hypothetical protein IMSAGC013_02206 [Lachnospiraceae bacterium]
MRKYFEMQYCIDNYNELIDLAINYINDQFYKNLTFAKLSIDNYRKYKEDTVSFDDIPSYKLESYKYKYVHSLNVAKKSSILANEENISAKVMIICGILHDIGHYICNYRLHGEQSALMAEDFLYKNSSIPYGDIIKIGNIIRAHYPKEWNDKYYKSDQVFAEDIILLEADFWDKNDLASFMEKTDIYGGSILKNKYERMQKNCKMLLKQQKEEQDCKYTKNYRKYIYEQLEKNKKLIVEID